MSELLNNSPAESFVSAPTSLPKLDYIRLPLVSLATILLIVGVSELLTRVIWAEHKEGSCTVVDPVAGDHFKPNCTIRTKNAEGPWTTYQYNECGYRSATSCGPKPPGAIRIAILGSSVSQALYVPYDQTYFARTASDLGRSCNRPIDVQNLGVPNPAPSMPIDGSRKLWRSSLTLFFIFSPPSISNNALTRRSLPRATIPTATKCQPNPQCS